MLMQLATRKPSVCEVVNQLFVMLADACKDDVLKLLRKVQAHESKGKTRLKERAATVAMYIGEKCCCAISNVSVGLAYAVHSNMSTLHC